MGYIKKLKNNELVGGTDKTTIYPVTSTEAVFEEVIEDGESNFKSQKFLNNNITGDRINEGTITDYNIAVGTVTKEKLTPQVQTMLDEGQKKALTPKGNYNSETEYEVLDLVFDPVTNSSYISLQTPNVGHPVDENAEGYEEGWWEKTLDGTAVNTAQAAIDAKVGQLETQVGTAITQAETAVDEAKQETLNAYTQAEALAQQITDWSSSEISSIPSYTDQHPLSNRASSAQIGYFECGTSSSTQASNQIKAVTAGGYALPTSGGAVKIKMYAANTYTPTTNNPVKLQFNADATTLKELKYNGEAVSPNNTWDAGEVISVYYDGTYYQASNAQGGGGKAEKIKYDNSQSRLAATDVQEALDEIEEKAVVYTPVGFYIPFDSSVSAWFTDSWLTTGDRHSFVIPRNPSWQRMKVTANANYFCKIAFLDNTYTEPIDGHSSEFISNHTIAAGTSDELNIPTNCAYIVVAASPSSTTNTEYLPVGIEMYETNTSHHEVGENILDTTYTYVSAGYQTYLVTSIDSYERVRVRVIITNSTTPSDNATLLEVAASYNDVAVNVFKNYGKSIHDADITLSGDKLSRITIGGNMPKNSVARVIIDGYGAVLADKVAMNTANISEIKPKVDTLTAEAIDTDGLECSVHKTSGSGTTITIENTSENNYKIHCITKTGYTYVLLKLPTGLVAGRQYKITYTYSSTSSSTANFVFANSSYTNVGRFSSFIANAKNQKVSIIYTHQSSYVYLMTFNNDITTGADIIINDFTITIPHSIVEIEDRISNLEPKVIPSAYYNGMHVELGNDYGYIFSTTSTSIRCNEGMAMYGDYIVCVMLAAGETYLNIYKKTEGVYSLVASITGLGLGHANSMQFAPTKADGATFPLLYISGCNDRKCYVVQINLTSETVEEVTTDTYSASVVQTISFPTTQKFAYSTNTNTQIGDDGYLYLYQLNHGCTRMRCPSVSEGNITMTEDDVYDFYEFHYPYATYVWQGGVIHKGMLFMPVGNSNKTKCLFVFDIYNHSVKAIIDLNYFMGVSEEPEDAEVYNGELYIAMYAGASATSSAALRKIKFL